MQTKTGAVGAATAISLMLIFGSPARAGEVTLCPTGANAIGDSVSDVPGPLDATCGSPSAVKIDISHTTDYGRLLFDSSTPGYPSGLTLGGLTGLSANVVSTGSGQPYFMLAFTDSSNSLGQTASTDQILLIEFQSSTLSGNTLAVDPNSTLFNLYDNTTGQYLEGPDGQHNDKTLAEDLTLFPSLSTESLEQIRIGEGLAGSDTGAESLTVNSLTIAGAQVPEPSSLALLGVALLGLTGLGYRRQKS